MTGPLDPHTLAGVQDNVGRLRAEANDLRRALETAGPQDKSAKLTAWTDARDRIAGALLNLPPSDLFSSIDAHVPLALLPVRLETRFADPGTDVLHVRIFPDDVHVDGHDAALTESEATLGTAMWAAPADILAANEQPPAEPPPADASDGRRARWAALVRLLGGPRATWVAHATRPGAPPPEVKTQAYARPPVARALPDRWLVRAYVGEQVVGEAWTQPIGVDLHLAPDPQAGPGDGAPGLPPTDPELRWLLDYQTAVGRGMAVDVTLPAGTTSIDRVVAVGVRASTTPADGEGELATLLTAHRYTDGLGFLRTGSPTANTPSARSADDRRADPDELWRQEFGTAANAGTAAAALANALALPSGVVDGTAGADDTGDARARAMQTATWAATWGYYLGELVDGSAAHVDVDAVRDHYLAFVRGRGTLPVLRVGHQPYGVLPLVPLDRWAADGASPTVDGLARLLQRVRPLWRYGAGRPVTESEGPGFEDAFARAMSTDAVGRSYQVRSAIADRTFDPAVFTGIDPKPGVGVVDALVGNLLGIGRNPLVLDIYSPNAQPVRAPIVVDPRDPTPDATVQASIRNLTATNPQLVLEDRVWLTPHPDSPATVLHTLLRRSLLLEYAAAGTGLRAPLLVNVAAAAPATSAVDRKGVAMRAAVAPASMLSGLTPDPSGGFAPVTSLPTVISTPVAAVTGGMATGEWLWRNPLQYIDLRRSLDQTLDALALLATLGADELELLLRETLDLATHRWTAWAESVAAATLARRRSATPAGIAIGGWGFVERLTRRPRTSVDPAVAKGAADGQLWEDVNLGGFVHAPSTAQAATAAVLRAAHLAHGGENDTTFAVDLSSGPARVAARLADGIRAGQELGALLGYELERDLHERSADVLVAPLRAYAPRWKASGTFVEGDAEEIVSPSAVVDGLAVANDDPNAVAAAVLPPAEDPALAAALAAALSTLRDHQHALADLLTAEAIHQVLAGNPTRAGAVLDAAGRGAPPPDSFDVLRTPRSGVALTYRLAVLLPTGALAGGWPDSPRGAADPDCAAWLAAVLPSLASIRLRVADAAGTVREQSLPTDARLGPLDVVLDQADVVRTRILLALPAGSSLLPGRDGAWAPGVVSLDELLTVAADLREVVASRALRALDLLNVGSSAPSTNERDADDLHVRVTATVASVQAAADDVTAAFPTLQAAAASPAGTGIASALTAAHDALVGALAHGVVLHLADTGDATEVLAALGAAASELARRLSLPVPAPGARVDDDVAALKGMLGAGQPAVPRLALGDALPGAAAALARGDGFIAGAPELAGDWLADVAPVRAAAGRLARAIDGCAALAGGPSAGGWRILEPTAGPAWSATEDAAALTTRGPATTVVAWLADTGLPAEGPVAGLLVDEWTEVVPQPLAATSIAYQAEAPTARAPQAILLGLAPDAAAGWDVETVVDLVREAAELATVRLVDAETGAWFGRMLPAVLLPEGDAADVIAAPALPLVQVDAAMLEVARLKTKALG